MTDEVTATGQSSAAGSRVTKLVAGGVALVAVIILIRIWSISDRALGDVALIELEVRRVLSTDPPSLGAYSRFGWRHPGPIAFYLLALPYRLLGSGAAALSTAALLLNVAWLLWTVLVLRRRGPAATTAFGACLLLMTAGMGIDGIGDAWNVSLTLVPLAGFMIGCWSMLCGDRSARWLAAASFTFIVHTHVGVAVVATPLAIVTLLVVLLTPDLRTRLRPTSCEWAAAGGIGLVVFLPLLVDTVRGWPGNAGRLVRWAMTNDLPTIGLPGAFRFLGRASSLTFPVSPETPRFLLWAETDSLGVLPGIFVVLVLAFGVAARRRGRRDEFALSGVIVVVWCSGLLAARSILDPPEWWLVEWLQPLGWMTIAAAVLLAWRLVARPRFGDPGRARLFGVGLLVAAIVVAAVSEVRTFGEFDGRSAIAVEPVELLTTAIDDAAGGRTARIATVDPDFSAENMLAGVVDEAVHRGVAVCVDARLAYKFPTSTVCSDDDEIVFLLRTETNVAPPPAGHEPIATYDHLSPADRRRADAASAALAEALRADGRDDLIGTLDTPLAADALLADPGPAVTLLRNDVLWLDGVRERPGLRFGLYRETE